jgi:hypothetical protein
VAWYGIAFAIFAAALVGLMTGEAPLVDAIDSTIRPLVIEPAAAGVALAAIGLAFFIQPRRLVRRPLGWGFIAVAVGFVPLVLAAIAPGIDVQLAADVTVSRLALIALPAFGAMAAWALPYRDAAARDLSAQRMAIAILEAPDPSELVRAVAELLSGAFDARGVLVRISDPEIFGSTGDLSPGPDDNAGDPGTVGEHLQLIVPIGRAGDPLGEVRIEARHGDTFGAAEREWLAAWLQPVAVVLRARRREIVVMNHQRVLADRLDLTVAELALAARQLPLASVDSEWAVPPTVDAREVLAQLSDGVTGVARHGEGLQGTASEARDRARSSSDAVARSLDRLAMLSEEIGRLTGHSDAIAASNDTVSGVAFRTNLVANNAALEATRAGAAGRTFGVLAEEVRRLADTTAATSVAIKGRTDALAADVVSLHAAVETTRRALGDAIRDAEVGEAAAQRMGESAAELEDIAHALGPAVEEANAVAKRRSARDQHLTGMMERFLAERTELARALTAHRDAMDRLVASLGRAHASLPPDRQGR